MTERLPSFDPSQAPEIDTSVAHSARVWNYLLGGKENFAADREAAKQVMQFVPNFAEDARADRGFLIRAVRYLTGEAGIRQFLDIGTGLPTANNTHEVAQAIAPECRIVYVDNDPLIMAHARALLTSTPQGTTDYIHADLREPDMILDEAGRTLDFTQPIALMMLGILNYIVDSDQARALVNRLVDAVPSGSYLAISHPTAEINRDAVKEAMRRWNESGGGAQITDRSPTEIARFFGDLELLEPGVVSDSLWRPDPSDIGAPVPVDQFGGVGRKP